MAELLIVDDEIHVVERLAALIPWHELGIEAVHRAFSADEALRLLEATRVDVVVTDIQMPGMNGLELVERVKARWRTTGCILLSGRAEFAYAQEAIQHGIADYLLKPVTDEELMEAVRRVLDEQERQWQEVVSRHKIEQALQAHLPLLRSSLLSELLQGHGRKYAEGALRERMEQLQLPALLGEPCALLLIRLEDRFLEYDPYSVSLLEYAIGNIAEELCAGTFELWSGRDSHDYLVFVAKPIVAEGGAERGQRLERAAAELQSAVRTYLRGSVSVLISAWGRFPTELTKLYEDALAAFRLRIGGERELLLSVSEERDVAAEIAPLRSLYELPGLAQLLEAGQWSEAAEKLERVGDELCAIGPESEEHLLEAFLAIGAAFTSIAHKNGRRLSGLLGATSYDRLFGGSAFRTAVQLKEWALQLLATLQADAEGEVKDSRTSLVRQVNRFIERHLAEDVSLQAIADNVHMHPVYVSRMYKLETGHNVSDYVYELRMERAAQLLTGSHDKIYEVAARLGYQRAHSFIHVFKKHYGLTPQEYRDKHQLQR